MADAVVKPAPLKFQSTGFINETFGYYCHACDGFHHVKQGEQSVVRAPNNARAILHAEGKKNGQHILTWAVGDQNDTERIQVQTVEFFPWPRRFPMTETEPLIHLTWELLMDKVAIIMGDPDATAQFGTNGELEEGQRRAKYEARGIAEVLAIQMKPFMESADHVVRCAVQYHKNPWFEVPGLAPHLWDPMKNPDGSPRIPVSTPRAAREAPRAGVKKAAPKVDNKSTKKLTDKEREGIREAVGSGMFTKEDVASMFKVSMAEIESALS